ncbi:MAG TPA: hypothetical protein VEZ90_05075, partial [Blastocatellia bacterium]|nr:hypothetical protein [Blastocatellia bacterium]
MIKELLRLRYLLLTVALLAFSAQHSVLGQQLGAPVGSTSNRVPGFDGFTSFDGRFTIGLPTIVSAFRSLNLKLAVGPATGKSYLWQVKGVVYNVIYLDRPAGSDNSDPRKALDDFSAGLAAGLVHKGGHILSEENMSLADFPGREIRIEAPTHFFIARVYLVKNRAYQLTVGLPAKRSPGQQSSAIRVLDSFKIIAEEEVAAIRRKQIAEATPDPLPQEPAAPKLEPDTSDQGLKGKVKSLVVEEEDKSGTWEAQGRKRSRTYEFNPEGYLTRSATYDYKGNPDEFAAYGYLE